MLTALISGLGVTVTPGVAHADGPGPQISCPTDPTIVWRLAFYGRTPYLAGYRYTAVSTASTFNVSDGRIVDNTLDTPINATFSSSQSRTWRISVTVGATAELTKYLQTNVSTQIVQERTTAIGVNASLVVPPHSRVTGQYGVQAYDVVYDVQTVYSSPANENRPREKCYDRGTQRGTTNAPTVTEGWRFIAG
ncbi:hypothetical protein [Sphaerisporangium rhizosphaerae]|uniref:Secreted protein n=1 Tax=Sphaerisporangium rhizosphaerae TaxID=2269375 RepID=A0ABW2P8B6_9ACTN